MDAAGSLRGVEPEGWVGLRRKSWGGAAGPEPEGRGGGGGAERRREFTLKRVHGQSPTGHVCGSYTGGSAAPWALHVGHGLKNIEGNKSDLGEGISTLPPAFGGLNHLFERKPLSREAPGAHPAWCEVAGVVTSSVSPCCTDSSVLFLAMKSYMQL